MGIRSKPLTPWQWCRLAASKDEQRPVLTGTYYTGGSSGSLVATDGHRLHVAPHKTGHSLPAAVYIDDDLATIAGKYPNYGQVVAPRDKVQSEGWVVGGGDRMMAALRGALGFWKASGGWDSALLQVPVNNAPATAAYVHPSYLYDALRGMEGLTYLYVPGPLAPLHLCDSTGRQAAVMPIRVGMPADEPASLVDGADALLVVQDPRGVPLNAPSLRLTMAPFLHAEKKEALASV